MKGKEEEGEGMLGEVFCLPSNLFIFSTAGSSACSTPNSAATRPTPTPPVTPNPTPTPAPTNFQVISQI